jgi:hypothetical protein
MPVTLPVMLPEQFTQDNTVANRRSQYPGEFWVKDMTNFYMKIDIRHDSFYFGWSQ